jgi:hypothetical protein
MPFWLAINFVALAAYYYYADSLCIPINSSSMLNSMLMQSSASGIPVWHSSLLAKLSGQLDWRGAAKDRLVSRSAVAVGVVGGAVEGLAAAAGAQGVVFVSEGVSPLGAQLVCRPAVRCVGECVFDGDLQ